MAMYGQLLRGYFSIAETINKSWQALGKLLAEHFLLIFAVGTLVANWRWAIRPLNIPLRWVGGILSYYRAYWLANIYIFQDVQKCNLILEDFKGWRPGYGFWEMRNDQWWLYMACLGNENGWSRGIWDNVVSITILDSLLILKIKGCYLRVGH